MKIEARILRSVWEVRQLAEEWRDLWQRCPGATTFQTPEWLLSWIEAFSPREVRAIEFRAGSHLTGLAPLLIYSNGPDQVLAFMGGGVSDYLDMLANPCWEHQIVEALLEIIWQEPGWNVLDLTDLPSTSVLVRAGKFHQGLNAHDTCSALRLPSSTGELVNLFSSRQRANLRNARSRLHHAGGALLELGTTETLSEFLDDLLRLHTIRWRRAGESGVLDDANVRKFHRLFAPRLLRQNALRLYRLRSLGRTLAAVEVFFETDTALCYMQGFDPESSYFSPGTQLMLAVMNEAIQAGIRKFDFLRGTEAYKQHWRAQAEPTFRITFPRSQLAAVIPQLAA